MRFFVLYVLMIVEVFNMASGFTTTLDTRAFNRELESYMAFQKREIADVINTKLYYIARNATMTTKAADRGKIDAELRAPSRDYPNVPLAAIIVNKTLGKGQGVEGAEMKAAVERLIRKRKASVNYVRSGWKHAIQILEKFIKASGGFRGQRPPVDRKTMAKQDTDRLGSATPARPVGSRVWGEIENKVGTQAKLSELEDIKQEGLQQAIDMEVSSMVEYIEKKLSKLNEATNERL